MDTQRGSRRVRFGVGLAVAVVAGAAFVSPAAAQDEQPYAGTVLNVSTYSASPEFDYYATIIPEFEAATGIDVNYVQQPIEAQDTKIPLQLQQKDPGLDVFFTGSENIGAYVGYSGVAPLDDFINDPNLTPAEWEFTDIAPAVQAACQQGGVTYCIASHANAGILYYNTRMFEEAGLTAPPSSPQELLEYAQALTTDEHAGFCVRADITQALYDAFQLWQWFYPYDNPVTGNYFDQEWNVILAEEPYASEFGQFWRDLLTTSAPEGIATYKFPDCLLDFQQGRVAMWHDASIAIPEVLDPEKSLVAGEVAFHSMPCQEVNPANCALVQPFGTWINNASENKEAAWLLVQFLTSKETQSRAAQAGALLTPSRLSVIADPATAEALPATFAETLTHVFEHPNVTLLPFIPEGVAIIPPIQLGLQELITTDKTVEQVMADLGAGIQAIMTDAGYPKPFPET